MRLAAQEAIPLPPPPPEQPARLAPSGISFRNSRAVLISLVVAALAFFAWILAMLLWAPLFPFVLCGAGFAAARIYRKETVEPLTPAGGARLGWMTGLWFFLIVALLCTIAAVALSTPQGWEQAKAIWAQFPEMSKGIGSQHDVVTTLLVRLPFLFLLLTLLPGLGGMLGARSSPRRRPSA